MKVHSGRFLDELNKEQKEAVLEEHKKICLIAGAGCGKTKTLINRIIYLLYTKKIKQESILVLTFAKKAIKEIKERLDPYIDHKKDINVYNFHSFCFFLLKKFSNFLFFDNRFKVYDQKDQEFIINQILSLADTENKEKGKRVLKKMLEIINNIKNEKKEKKFSSPEIEIFYNEYEKFLKKNTALDFNDLIIFVFKLFSNNPKLCDNYKKIFSHILIDEAQDINSIQWKVLNLLIGKEQNLFIVGDPNQTIYGFQGACCEKFISLSKKKEWKTFYLNVNYRSSRNILSISNLFIELNKDLVQNKLVSIKKNQGEKVNWIPFISMQKLIDIVIQIKEKKKIFWSDIAIIYRNNILSKGIENELIKRKIPYEILGSYAFLEREEIKDVIRLWSAILYQDDVSMIKTLKWQKNIGEKTINLLIKESKEKEIGIFNLLSSLEKKKNKINSPKRKSINELIKKINFWKKKLLEKTEKNLVDYLKNTIISFNYLSHLSKSDLFKEKKTNLEKLINLFLSWKENESEGQKKKIIDEMDDFIQWITIMSENRELYKKKNLILSSIHQVKGLEFDTVFFVFIDEGMIPNKNCEDILEEKRLFYVALTRAKNNLFLVNSYNRCSPFLKDIISHNNKTLRRLWLW